MVESFKQENLDKEKSSQESQLGKHVLAFTKRITKLVKESAVIDMRGISSEEKSRLWSQLGMVDKIATILVGGSGILIFEAMGKGITPNVHDVLYKRDISALSSSFFEQSLIPFTIAAIALCSKKMQQKLKSEFEYENPTVQKFFPFSEED